MKRCTERAFSLALLAALGAGASQCVTDHDALEKKDTPSAGAGGGGSAGKGGSSGSGASGAQGGNGGSAGKYVETPGRNVVTFLHGVVDEQRVAFCFGRAIDGALAFSGTPLPQDGLDYAHSFSLETIDGLDFSSDSIVPYVLGGDLAELLSLDCGAAVAKVEQAMTDALPYDGGAGSGAGGDGGAAGSGTSPGTGGAAEVPEPPLVRGRALPALPAGTLSGGLSYLFVAAGCIGGPWFVDQQDEKVCGEGYEGKTTLVPIVVSMSRDSTLNLGLQGLHASRASGQLDLRVLPANVGVDPPLPIANDLVEGLLAPRPPQTKYSRFEVGVDDSGFMLELTSGGVSVLSEPWHAALERGDLDDALQGENYVIVFVGPEAGLGLANWWNTPALTIVKSDP